jgi:signal transduction histidine kinase/ActR/RegA family two-component response regulator
MTSFTSLRARLVGTVFVAITPAWVLMYYTDLPWAGFAVGLLALGAAWFGGERFILRQVRLLLKAARQLREGDLSSRTGLSEESGELGELARTLDTMAASLELRVKEREQAERTLLHRSFQQTVVGALGQFAMVSEDVSALLNQAVMLVGQTIEVEYCGVFEAQPGSNELLLRAGMGWKSGCVESATVPSDRETECGFTLSAGEPVVIENLATEARFRGSAVLGEHGVTSGVVVAVAGHGRSFGVLGAYTAQRRTFTEDEVHFLLAVATVLAMALERIRAQAELQKLAAFVQLNPNPAMELAEDGTINYFNDAALSLALSMGRNQPSSILPANVQHLVHTCLASNQSVRRLETQIERRTLTWSFHPVLNSRHVHCYVEDITERVNLEAQLRQSQKMESVGQLAAGVAHDFNNMLTIIQGHAGMLVARAAQAPELLDSSQAIYFAAERAAGLTRQLLMFSRKNVMQPKPLDLREVVSHMSKMLQRLLGETITLQLDAPPTLPLTHADIGMVEQVIMNLAVNARDAMPKGGLLTIRTDLFEVDAEYLPTHPQARLGNFVRLRVTDTGCGMDATTMSRIFEPFFTTKEVGKGTGLGLATVYCIVKQHEGWIEVVSEVGKGSTFAVFFPASDQLAEAHTNDAGPVTEVRGGKETILIVEDEPVLREMAHTILGGCGYHILEAGSGVEALRVWEQQQVAIDLVLTDMVMPEGLSGMDLAEKLRAANPELKIIFASGYSMENIDTGFIRKTRGAFLQKPYTHVTLAQAVRDCLDEKE